MPPTTSNPLVVLTWILAVFIGLPGLLALVRLIWFLAEASTNLKTVVSYVHERRSVEQATETTMALMENDITAIQEHCELPTHPWPERRVGPADRRDRRAG